MKKLILLTVLVLVAATLPAKGSATLRLGSVDISEVSPGDTIVVPVFLDDITPGTQVMGLQIRFLLNGEVIMPSGAVETYFGTGWVHDFDYDYYSLIWGNCSELLSIPPGSKICGISFIYNGGQTNLTFDGSETIMVDADFEFMYLTLINGCVCHNSDVTENKSVKSFLFPNPTNGKFYLEINNLITESIEIQITNLHSTVIYTGEILKDEKTEIDLTGQPRGLYFVRLKQGQEQGSGKLVIQ